MEPISSPDSVVEAITALLVSTNAACQPSGICRDFRAGTRLRAFCVMVTSRTGSTLLTGSQTLKT